MAYFALLYGLLTIVGGVIGYMKAGSMVSIIAGGISGALILASAVALLQGKPLGYFGLIGLSAALAVFFGIRFFQSWAFMPAGMMIALSLITLIGLLIKRPDFITEGSQGINQ
jgi:uncharacterized membrane protein (UPF0136 family)